MEPQDDLNDSDEDIEDWPDAYGEDPGSAPIYIEPEENSGPLGRAYEAITGFLGK